MRFNPLFRPAAEARLIYNYGETPRVPTGAELHPEIGSEFHTEAQEMIKNAQGMGKQVEASRNEANNNVHWGPFQRAEQEFQRRFAAEFVGPNNISRQDGTPQHFHPNNIVLANIALWQALQNPNNTALRTRMRAFKEEFCKTMNEQFAKQNINWRLGPGLDNQTNYDGQRGDRYTDIRPHQEALNKGLQEYSEAFQKFVRSRPMGRGQQGIQMPSMGEILRFKIEWCAQKNQTLDKMQADGRTNEPGYTTGRFYEGCAWNALIAFEPEGRAVQPQAPQPAPAPAPAPAPTPQPPPDFRPVPPLPNPLPRPNEPSPAPSPEVLEKNGKMALAGIDEAARTLVRRPRENNDYVRERDAAVLIRDLIRDRVLPNGNLNLTDTIRELLKTTPEWTPQERTNLEGFLTKAKAALEPAGITLEVKNEDKEISINFTRRQDQ